MRVKIAPPASAGGRRVQRPTTTARAASPNIIAASVEAYIEAINELLDEAHWSGATEDAGNRRRTREAGAEARRAELDEDEGRHDVTAWFER